MRQPPSLLETGGHRLLIIMATEAEYGPCLRQRIQPVITGVGPVEAAIGASRALQDCLDHACIPDLVLSLGSAGSQRLEQGAVYQVSSVTYRDMDASPLGFEKGRTPFLDLPAELTLPIRLREIPTARLSTGANIVSGPAYAKIDADMVDMETFAVFRACQQFSIPMIGLRGISDGAAELRHYQDWAALLGHLDQELASILDRFETLLLPAA
jgi:adenosylhomocysteine nucleosidase